MHTTTHEQHGLRRSFDTELLEQIIEVEVDEAVRALRERKIIVDAEKQHHWNEFSPTQLWKKWERTVYCRQSFKNHSSAC
jgi:hypothetical protein